MHGKGSLLGKMAGDDWQKFANLRAYYAFMWGYPGKKLLFMGQEFAQRREWSEARALDWDLLDLAPHRGVRRLVRDLNRLYRSRPALHARDCEPEGFSWLIVDDSAEFGLCLAAQRAGRQPGRRDLATSRRCRATTTACRCRRPAPGARSSTPMPSTMAARARAMAAASKRAPTGQGISAAMLLPPLSTIMLELVDDQAKRLA